MTILVGNNGCSLVIIHGFKMDDRKSWLGQMVVKSAEKMDKCYKRES